MINIFRRLQTVSYCVGFDGIDYFLAADALTAQRSTDQSGRAHGIEMAAKPLKSEQVRLQHHEQMQRWVKEQGVTLPDNNCQLRRRTRSGMGPGGGMGGMGSVAVWTRT